MMNLRKNGLDLCDGDQIVGDQADEMLQQKWFLESGSVRERGGEREGANSEREPAILFYFVSYIFSEEEEVASPPPLLKLLKTCIGHAGAQNTDTEKERPM